ncbi:MAG: glycosyltransferase family 39 protein [Sphingobacteriales bacterium]|nr:glycosyltransferase family 39 protein [Sphingobacteriales bacterium]
MRVASQKYSNEILILILSLIYFIPFLGQAHLFDWDEINFAEAAREMLATHNYFNVQIDYKDFWEKPPLFIWMQVFSMKIFGVNEFAARFPNAMAGVVTLLTIFRIGKKYLNTQFAWFWTMCYAGTTLTLLYFKSGIMDPWFNLFIFLAIYQFSFIVERGREKSIWKAVLAGLFLGLAVMVKGPVAILIALLCLFVYIIIHRFDVPIKFSELLAIVITTGITCFMWFGVQLTTDGIWFLREFIVYQIRLFTTQDAGHGGPFFYHWIVLLFGCFPASILMIKSFFMRSVATEHQRVLLHWMQILFWVVLILFSIVETKIVHYSSLCYFPLTFLAAYALYYMVHGKTRWNKVIHYTVYFIGLLFAFILMFFPFLMKHKNAWILYVKDAFAVGNLEANVNWTIWDASGGVILFAGLMVYFIMNQQHHYRKAIIALFVSMMFMVFFTSLLIVPKIELISQAAAIRFYESKVNEDAYVQPMYFKSYAHLFYTKKKQPTNPLSYDHEWLKTGKIDKPVYIIVKNTKKFEFEKYADIKLLYEENGFAFFKREIPR